MKNQTTSNEKKSCLEIIIRAFQAAQASLDERKAHFLEVAKNTSFAIAVSNHIELLLIEEEKIKLLQKMLEDLATFESEDKAAEQAGQRVYIQNVLNTTLINFCSRIVDTSFVALKKLDGAGAFATVLRAALELGA